MLERFSRITTYLFLALAVLFSLFPVYWLILAGFRHPETVYSDIGLWPARPSIQNFIRIQTFIDYGTQYKNSLIVAFSVTFATMVLSTFSAYAIARFDFRGRKLLTVTMLFSYMFPPLLTLIPLYVYFVHLGIAGTLFSLVLANLAVTMPLAIWMLWGFFRSMPFQLEEAAMIDGCSRLGAFVRIILPLARPGLLSVALFSFLISWNDYTAASILITEDANKTLPIGLAQVVANMTGSWGVAMAACASIVAPLIVVFIFLNRYFIQGLVGSGVKG